jgi:hypothetical protein
MVRSLALSLAALACMAAMPCAAGVNKCVDAKGRVTYQDGACPALPAPEALAAAPAAAKMVSTTEGADYTSARGAWRGPVQFQFTVDGQRQADAQAATPVVIELESDGRLKGAVDGAGCKLLGVHTQPVAPTAASIDVTVSGCRDARFNARYAGQLNASAASKDARLSLQAVSSAPAGKLTQASIEAVLRR